MSLGRGSCVFWYVYTVLSMLFVKFSLMTIVILSLQSYTTLANAYHYQSIITKFRLIKATVFSFLLVLSVSFGVLWHSYFLIYGSPAITILAITIVIFTWCWTYKLIARHQRAIQKNSNSLTQSKYTSKEGATINNNRVRHHFMSFDKLRFNFVLASLWNTCKYRRNWIVVHMRLGGLQH